MENELLYAARLIFDRQKNLTLTAERDGYKQALADMREELIRCEENIAKLNEEIRRRGTEREQIASDETGSAADRTEYVLSERYLLDEIATLRAQLEERDAEVKAMRQELDAHGDGRCTRGGIGAAFTIRALETQLAEANERALMWERADTTKGDLWANEYRICRAARDAALSELSALREKVAGVDVEDLAHQIDTAPRTGKFGDVYRAALPILTTVLAPLRESLATKENES